MMFKRLCLIMTCAFIALTCACSDQKGSQAESKKTDYPAQALDVTVKSCPQRVISLSPAATDIIIALGSDAQLVGISDNCVEHRELERFGTSVTPDIAAIKGAKPDVVFMSAAAGESDIQRLTDSGIVVAKLSGADSYNSLADLYADVAVIMSGNITGARNASNTFAAIDSRIKSACNSNQKKITAAVFVNDTVSIRGSGVAVDIAAFAGIERLLSGSDEEIVKAGPQLILCPVGAAEQFKARFDTITVAEFDMSLFDRRSELMADAVNSLIALINGDQPSD